MKKFSIPVNWEVWDKVEVEAETIEEAIQWLKDHIDEIPLGTEPEYIDGSYKIEDGQNGEASIEEAIHYLKEYWNLSGGIDGEEIEENLPLETLTIKKDVKQFGFKKGDVLTVKRNIMNECVIIVPDDNKPNVILSEETVKNFGVLSGAPQLHFH